MGRPELRMLNPVWTDPAPCLRALGVSSVAFCNSWPKEKDSWEVRVGQISTAVQCMANQTYQMVCLSKRKHCQWCPEINVNCSIIEASGPLGGTACPGEAYSGSFVASWFQYNCTGVHGQVLQPIPLLVIQMWWLLNFLVEWKALAGAEKADKKNGHGECDLMMEWKTLYHCMLLQGPLCACPVLPLRSGAWLGESLIWVLVIFPRSCRHAVFLWAKSGPAAKDTGGFLWDAEKYQQITSSFSRAILTRLLEPGGLGLFQLLHLE